MAGAEEARPGAQKKSCARLNKIGLTSPNAAWLWRFWQAHLHPEQLVFIDETGAYTQARASLWPRVSWPALGGQSPLRPLEDDDVRRGAASCRNHRSLGRGWTDERFGIPAPMSSSSWSLCSGRETSSSWTIWPLTKWPAYARRSRLSAQLVYLPPYSPDLNPIELAFAKFKTLLRSAAARAVDQLETVIADCLDQFTTSECRNYFRHCGYSVR